MVAGSSRASPTDVCVLFLQKSGKNMLHPSPVAEALFGIDGGSYPDRSLYEWLLGEEPLIATPQIAVPMQSPPLKSRRRFSRSRVSTCSMLRGDVGKTRLKAHPGFGLRDARNPQPQPGRGCLGTHPGPAQRGGGSQPGPDPRIAPRGSELVLQPQPWHRRVMFTIGVKNHHRKHYHLHNTHDG